MNDLVLKDIVINYTPAVITGDLAPLREQMTQLAEQYAKWTVTEDDLPAADRLLADLNQRVLKPIDDKRKAIKKAITEPFDVYEIELKKIAQLATDLITSIKGQTDKYEKERQQRKRAFIERMPEWDSRFVFNPKWLNKGYKLEDIDKEVHATKLATEAIIRDVVETCEIVDLPPEQYVRLVWEGYAKDIILGTIDRDNALAEKVKNKALEEQAKRAEVKSAGEQVAELFSKSPLATPKTPAPFPADFQQYHNVIFFGTQAQLDHLKKYATSIGAELN